MNLDREKNHIGFAEPRKHVVNLEQRQKNYNCLFMGNNSIKDAEILLIYFVL